MTGTSATGTAGTTTHSVDQDPGSSPGPAALDGDASLTFRTLLTTLTSASGARPDPGLNDALDAAAEVFARYGVAHTSVLDIARELGVSKATAYRHVGSIEDARRLVLTRELHEVLTDVAATVEGASGAELVITPVVEVVSAIAAHPIFRKFLADEPHLLGELLPAARAAQAMTAGFLTTYLEALDRNGDVAVDDPTRLAELIVQVMAAAILDTPADLRGHITYALAPHLGTP